MKPGKMVTAIAKQMITTERIGARNVKGDANSPVTTYFISGEELDKYRAMPAPSTARVKESNSRIW